MSLRPGAVNFEEKWRGLESTISAVVSLSPVSHTTWNDQYSYPWPATPPSLSSPHSGVGFVVSLTELCRDIYALCEAFPTSYADTLYKETQALLQKFVAGLLEVRVHLMFAGQFDSFLKRF